MAGECRPRMIPVTQTTFGDEGNCLAAAVASICHLTLSSVPDLRGDHWWSALTAWACQFGWAPLYLQALPPQFTGYCIGLGDGPRGRRHAIVWAGGPNGGIAHDPHPSRDGLIAWPHGYVLLAPLSPGGKLVG